MTRHILMMAAMVLLAAAVAQARNIDLVTLPPRDAVQLTIYNSEDLTLVKEIRSITFKKGVNRLEFAWANTLIDPTSVYFRPLEHDSEIDVADTTFPADRPQVLIWNVESRFEGQVRVEVSYFTSGISWSADYVMITDPGEAKMGLDGYVTVVNNSGEDYEGAQVRLVVGVINLVEKIAQLANRPRPPAPGAPASTARPEDKAHEVRKALEAADEVSGPDFFGGPAGARRAPPAVIKEGLSEYFIFTVEGKQTVKTGWSQRMISFRAKDVPFEIVYRYRPHQYGPRPVRFFILANDTEHKMGDSPLPDGVIRVFRENGKSGLNFFTAQPTKYIPIKEKIELNVGKDDQIVYERVVLDVSRMNFIFDENPQPARVVGWDETRRWQEEIRNYRDKPIKMEIRHVLPGDVQFTMEGAKDLKLYDFQTPEYVLELKAHERQKYVSEGLFHMGRSQKQNRVLIKG